MVGASREWRKCECGSLGHVTLFSIGIFFNEVSFMKLNMRLFVPVSLYGSGSSLQTLKHRRFRIFRAPRVALSSCWKVIVSCHAKLNEWNWWRVKFKKTTTNKIEFSWQYFIKSFSFAITDFSDIHFIKSNVS